LGPLAKKEARMIVSTHGGGARVFAAAYTACLSQNHGFVDGHKRAAFVTGAVFLGVNGYRVEAKQAEVIAAMLSLAENVIGEAGYSQ
jgi:death-on-curing protein